MTALAIPADLVGLTVGPLEQLVDARWLMAYAAGLGETAACYYDTGRPGGPAAHPLFPVCYEWPAALAVRARLLDEAAGQRGVHLTHRLLVHRVPVAGDRLATTACVVGVERHRAGALVTLRFATVDDRGVPVTTTDHGSLYRDVDVSGAPVPGPAGPPRARPAPPASEEAIAVAPQAAHVYTECARIWNPIHTDTRAARAAGLPGPILHGTATLALAVGRLVARDLGGVPGAVREVAARFTGMVPMPVRLALRRHPRAGDRLAFEVALADGRVVLGGEVAAA